MEGVTTAIVLFVFVCVIYPQLIKNKTQFYGAFAMLLVIILLHSLGLMIGISSAGFQVFAGAMTGLLQIGAIVLLFSAAGGISMRELTGEMAKAYEVIRRGDHEKTIIVPLTGEQPPPRRDEHSSATVTPPVENIQAPPGAGWPTKKPDDTSSLPLT